MSDHSNFQDLLNEYMKKNFDDLMNLEDEKNSLFNMILAHLILNWVNTPQQNMTLSNNDLDEIIRSLDKMLKDNKQTFENTLQLLTNNIAED